MEAIIIVIVIVLIAVATAYPTSSTSTEIPSITRPTKATKGELCEKKVTATLRGLSLKSYVVFENLILPSNGNTPYTEIDHVIVSPYGIFCIETKSHSGAIYGSSSAGLWKQYLGGKKFDTINPHRQNYKHIKALEDLLGANVKAKIHSYVVYPNAYSVKIDGKRVDYSINEVMRKISQHTANVYDLNACERILKTLAYASSQREHLKETHSQGVQAYLRRKSLSKLYL